MSSSSSAGASISGAGTSVSGAGTSISGLGSASSKSSSSAGGPKAAALVANVNDQKLRITQLETDNAKLKTDMEHMEANVERIRSWCNKYKRKYDETISITQAKFEEMDAKIKKLATELEDTKTAQLAHTSGSESSSDSEAERVEVLTKKERKAVEASMAAFSDTNLLVSSVIDHVLISYHSRHTKELTRYVFRLRLGVPKLKAVKLPWYPDFPSDSPDWPQESGTNEKLLRFRWDKPWDNDDNFYSIRMIISHMKRHGAQLVPSASTALNSISEEDLQSRVVAKFTALQKDLRMEGFLDAQNRKIIRPGVGVLPVAEHGEENNGNGGGPAVVGDVDVEVQVVPGAATEKKKKKSALLSRAKGVSTISMPLRVIDMTFGKRNLPFELGRDPTCQKTRSSVVRNTIMHSLPTSCQTMRMRWGTMGSGLGDTFHMRQYTEVKRLVFLNSIMCIAMKANHGIVERLDCCRRCCARS